MFLHWRANLADQNKQQPLKINIRVTYHTVLSVWNKPLIDTACQHCSTSRANQALRSLMANAGFQNRRVLSASVSFLPLPLPLLSFFGSCFISRAAKTENPVPRSFFAPKPNGNACYAGYGNEDFMTQSILFLWDKEVNQIIQKSPRTINTSLFGEGGGGKESVAILTALSKFARKTVLKINWSVKTPWLERMQFAPSGLWAPGQC